MMKGRRAISNAARPRMLPTQHKAWHPSRGIVFKPSPGAGSPRRNTSSLAGVEQELLSRSDTEYYYVPEPATVSTLAEAQKLEQTRPGVDNSADTPPVIPNIQDDAFQDQKYAVLPEQVSPWKMTEELFRAAKNAPAESPSSYWSHTLYRGPTLDKNGNPTKVTVHYCTSKNTTERVLKNYFEDVKVIGFDIEWLHNAHKSLGPKKHVSLIQIASEDRIALFHIALFTGTDKKDLVAPSLKRILEDPGVTKVGVAIKGDCTRIKNNLDIESKGLFELSHLYKLVKFSESKEFKQINKKLISLAIQVQEHLHLPIFKGGDVRSSDWSKALNLAQIRYAASDSYAGIHLYQTMEMKRKALDPTPPCPYHAELNIPIRTAEGIEIPTDEATEEVEAGELEMPAPANRKTSKQTPYVPPKDSDLEDTNFEDPKLPSSSISNHPYIHPTTWSRESNANSDFMTVIKSESTRAEGQIGSDSSKSIANPWNPTSSMISSPKVANQRLDR
ncbi:uncharacterized protein BP5553_01180 [Venustampulla echinocandica]|uniref:3'-5' exonuclease domain-containing protein n=1 Tax=Venustampulla echinocandica TaxID=2656787 RepID=A0A370U096_9HELO|nr:uncharacterized protein BP5553_01180 [Venustampulla echinocandica]RDL41201.1 hypothetical protein BP5553_01180 [Venustampulla echinocandica]